MHRSLGFVALILGSLGLLAAATVLAEDMDGKALYDANCAKCHGADGHADTAVGKAMKVPSLVDPKWAAEDSTDALIAAFHANPKHKAVAKNVNDDDLTAIAGHIRELASAGQ